MADQQTLGVYAKRAADYANRFGGETPSQHLRAFMDALPAEARVLDLGCGPGHAAAFMIANGFKVDAWDASAEMAQLGQDLHGLAIRLATFEELDAISEYDGIFANFSLLHAPKATMPKHLDQIAKALKPNGLFHIGLKTGTGERRDEIGRFYAFYKEDELAALLTNAGFSVETRAFGEGRGLDGALAPWIILKARKHG